MPLPVVLSLLERGTTSPRDRDFSIRICRSSCGLELGSCRPFSRAFVGAGLLLVFFSLLGCDGIIVILLCLRGCSSAAGFASGFGTLCEPRNVAIRETPILLYYFLQYTLHYIPQLYAAMFAFASASKLLFNDGKSRNSPLCTSNVCAPVVNRRALKSPRTTTSLFTTGYLRWLRYLRSDRYDRLYDSSMPSARNREEKNGTSWCIVKGGRVEK